MLPKILLIIVSLFMLNSVMAYSGDGSVNNPFQIKNWTDLNNTRNTFTYIYQEDANVSYINSSEYFLYANYTKPTGASQIYTLWKMKVYGVIYNAACTPDEYIYNFSIPNGCWNYGDKLMFRYHWGIIQVNQFGALMYNVNAECYSGSSWEQIYYDQWTWVWGYTPDTSGNPALLTTDGNWSTGAGWNNKSQSWASDIRYSNGIGCTPLGIYEEAINWSISPNFILMNDLKSSDIDYIGLGNNWTPLNTLTKFDGNNHIIYDLIISSGSNIGLFGTTNDISNLGLLNCSITGSQGIGSIGSANIGIINNSFANCTLAATNDPNGREVGGLVAYNYGTISNSWTSGNIGVDSYYSGGLVAKNYGNIFNCYSSSSISGGSAGNFDAMGGLVGLNNGVINTSYATGRVFSSAGWRADGGLVGRNYGEIINSYSTGSTLLTSQNGALVGWFSDGTIINSYSLFRHGTFVADTPAWNTSAITSSYYPNETISSYGGIGKTLDQMTLLSTFVNWSIDLTPINFNNNFYPYLGFSVGLKNFIWYIWDGTLQKGNFMINSFSNGLTTETFNFNELAFNYVDSNNITHYYTPVNFTRYLNISKYSHITGASINFSGFYYPRQDSPQESSSSYSTINISGNEWNDNNFSTYSPTSAIPTGDVGWIYVNYTKPIDMLDMPSSDDALIYSFWFIYTNTSEINPMFIDNTKIKYYPDKVVLAIKLNSSSDSKVYFYIHNGTSWNLFDSVSNNGQSSHNSNRIYEERMVWTQPIYPRNLTLEIGTPDGVNEWEYKDKLYKTNVRSPDLKFAINNYLSNCSTNVCFVPFLFTNQGYGHLRYSAIQVNYDSIPKVELVTPNDETSTLPTSNFICNSTDKTNLKNTTINIWNSTDLYFSETKNISSLNNLTTFSITFSTTGQYTWNCLTTNNNSYSNSQETNNTVNVDVEFITQDSPINNKWLNNNNLIINCTAVGINLDSAFLFGNFTGVWGLNQTINNIVSGVTNQFQLNLTDGSYLWACAKNKTSNSSIVFSPYNYTLNIDTVLPNMNNMTIITTPNSNQIWVLTNITDNNLDSCRYSIGTGTQTSFICNEQLLITAPGFGTFTLYTYGRDKAGNENTQGLFFTTSLTTGSVISGGSSSSSLATADWSMTTESNDKVYLLQMSSGSSREKILLFNNNGNSIRNIKLRCAFVSGSYDMCQNIIYESDIKLPVLKGSSTLSTFTVDVTNEIPNGNYVVDLIALDDLGNEDIISINIQVSAFGVIADTFVKLTSSKDIAGVQVPYIIIFTAMIIPTGFGSYTLTKKRRFSIGISLGVAFIISFIILSYI